MQIKNIKGFTLLEVLIALAVLALGLGAIVKISSQNISELNYLKDKTFAHWVALYKVNEIKLKSQKDLPRTGSERGYMEMGGQEWSWVTKTKVFDIKPPGGQAIKFNDTRQIDVEVRYKGDKGDPLIRFTSFITK